MGHGTVRDISLLEVLLLMIASSPVVVFLSDGECHIADETVYDLCRAAVRLGFVKGLFVFRTRS